MGMIIFKLSSEEVVNKGDTVVVIRRDCCDIVSSSFTKQTKSWRHGLLLTNIEVAHVIVKSCCPRKQVEEDLRERAEW